MIDTLYVVTAVQDTLKLALQSSENSGFMLQLITLLIALVAVVVGPLISLHVAKKQRNIDEKKIKETKEIEEKKIKSDLILKEKQKWLNQFKEIILDIKTFFYQIVVRENNQGIITIEDIINLINYMHRITLHCNSKDQNAKEIARAIKELIDYDSITYEETAKKISRINARIQQHTVKIITKAENEINNI